MGRGLDLSGSGQGQVTCFRECGNKPLGSVKCGKCLGLAEKVSASEKKNCAP